MKNLFTPKTLPAVAIGCLTLAMLACSLDDIFFPRTFYVTKTADTADGDCTADDCSLREAVIASNETPGHNEIVISAGTYVLTLPETSPDSAAGGSLNITDGVDIHGEAWMTTINGNATSRIFHVRKPARVEIQGLNMVSGDANFGGGILNDGDLTLKASIVNLNVAHTEGGGIYNSGTLTLTQVYVSANTSEGAGGGISNGGSYTDVDGSGGDGTLIVQQGSVITGNQAGGLGGGIYNSDLSHLQMEQTIVTQNSAESSGGGLYNGGALILTDVEIASNLAGRGGGLFTTWDNDAEDLAEARQVLIHDNTGASGGGIYDERGSLSLVQSAVINNTAQLFGGGIYVGPVEAGGYCLNELSLLNVTLSGNSAGGVGTGSGGAMFVACGGSLAYVTIAANTSAIGVGGIHGAVPSSDGVVFHNVVLSGNEGANCYGPLMHGVTLGHNIDSGNTCAFNPTDNLVDTDPLLDSLQEISGTFIHPLLAGSPGIDAAGGSCPATDQRLAHRPFGAACDIGAYEFGATVLGLTNQLPLIVSPTAVSSTPTTILSPILTPTATRPAPPVPPTSTHTLQPTLEPSDTPVPTATATTGLIIVTIGPFLPSSTPIP